MQRSYSFFLNFRILGGKIEQKNINFFIKRWWRAFWIDSYKIEENVTLSQHHPFLLSDWTISSLDWTTGFFIELKKTNVDIILSIDPVSLILKIRSFSRDKIKTSSFKKNHSYNFFINLRDFRKLFTRISSSLKVEIEALSNWTCHSNIKRKKFPEINIFLIQKIWKWTEKAHFVDSFSQHWNSQLLSFPWRLYNRCKFFTMVLTPEQMRKSKSQISCFRVKWRNGEMKMELNMKEIVEIRCFGNRRCLSPGSPFFSLSKNLVEN